MQGEMVDLGVGMRAGDDFETRAEPARPQDDLAGLESIGNGDQQGAGLPQLRGLQDAGLGRRWP